MSAGLSGLPSLTVAGAQAGSGSNGLANLQTELSTAAGQEISGEISTTKAQTALTLAQQQDELFNSAQSMVTTEAQEHQEIGQAQGAASHKVASSFIQEIPS